MNKKNTAVKGVVSKLVKDGLAFQKRRDLTDESFADLLGVDRVTWHRWKTGEKSPNPKGRAALTQMLKAEDPTDTVAAAEFFESFADQLRTLANLLTGSAPYDYKIRVIQSTFRDFLTVNAYHRGKK